MAQDKAGAGGEEDPGGASWVIRGSRRSLDKDLDKMIWIWIKGEIGRLSLPARRKKKCSLLREYFVMTNKKVFFSRNVTSSPIFSFSCFLSFACVGAKRVCVKCYLRCHNYAPFVFNDHQQKKNPRNAFFSLVSKLTNPKKKAMLISKISFAPSELWRHFGTNSKNNAY